MAVVAQSSDMLDFETSDQVSSSDDYARRFAGPAGEWMLSVQETIVRDLLKGAEGGTVLDVGGGHGQIAVPLSKAGFKVTVLGSSESCAKRLGGDLGGGNLSFVVGNPLALPFPDRSFDVVTCLRLVSHTDRWQTLLSEMKRVARRAVIIDFPPLISFNLLNPLLFKLKKKMEGNTRPFTIFTNRQIELELQREEHGSVSYKPQFFFPMVVHRKLNNPKTSALLEKAASGMFLTKFFGSPVIAEWKREQ